MFEVIELSSQACAYMMQSMFAKLSYSEEVRAHGETAKHEPTTTYHILPHSTLKLDWSPFLFLIVIIAETLDSIIATGAKLAHVANGCGKRNAWTRRGQSPRPTKKCPQEKPDEILHCVGLVRAGLLPKLRRNVALGVDLLGSLETMLEIIEKSETAFATAARSSRASKAACATPTRPNSSATGLQVA
jgi:hypothetical protein